MTDRIRAQVARELEAIPRGSLAQNIYRMAYELARLNGLGANPQLPSTAVAAHEVALKAARGMDPEFKPTLE